MFSPYDLEKTDDYLRWREKKLENSENYYKEDTPPLFITFLNGQQPQQNELDKLLKHCQLNSFALYRIEDHDKYDKHRAKIMIHDLARRLGLKRLDGNLCADVDKLTSITNTEHKEQHEYIPYSTKRLSWHTDGYYNPPDRTINSMLLHCFRNAKQGGESYFMDHEIMYLLLRDENPDYIGAFWHVINWPEVQKRYEAAL